MMEQLLALENILEFKTNSHTSWSCNIHIHCSCLRLQLASIEAAESVPQIQKMFGMITNLWKVFFYSPSKAEKLKEIQAVFNLPVLKLVQPSITRGLSHERCVRAICKELPALIMTLQKLDEASGDAEAYGVQLILSSCSAVCEILTA